MMEPLMVIIIYFLVITDTCGWKRIAGELRTQVSDFQQEAGRPA
jgi:hypothetical protein